MEFFAIFILTFIVWMILTWNIEFLNIMVGILACAFVSFIFSKEFKFDRKIFEIKRYFYFIGYLFVFIYYMIKANLLMAYRVLSPRLPIKPGIVKIPVELKSPLARAILANSITLTPGTFTLKITDQFLYIHWIYIYTYDKKQQKEKIVGLMEKILKKVFE
ncbi:MAG: Na+/H+ antiporter subunit E [Candidatus Omnitrophica bacterium]|nr:Na+/H+ antiporter subunit E [Candidatus Omnitrophota bacterium]MCM8809360.1 Na+/H+ antiporter subunit E [Candidatus Omnitrophota bacterium]MCM8832635.1 Na+/H+ antiporter subunit E [Candidatus Omnitrophota bacterium]